MPPVKQQLNATKDVTENAESNVLGEEMSNQGRSSVKKAAAQRKPQLGPCYIWVGDDSITADRLLKLDLEITLHN